MTKVLFDEVLQTDYGQFSLAWGADTWDGRDERFFANQVNGWVGAAVPDSVYVVLARKSGGSGVRVELWDERPSLTSEAEDVVEVSISVPPSAEVRWEEWAPEGGGPLALPAGDYRLRVSAIGRDAGQAGEFAETVVDWYCLQLWPAPLEADAVLRSTSNDATDWNATWGNRRPSQPELR